MKTIWLVNAGGRKRRRRNPALAIYSIANGKGRKMAKGRKSAHRRRRTSSGASRRIHANPRRRHSRRRHYRRNPAFAGGGGFLPPIKQIAGGIAGAGLVTVGTRFVQRNVPQIPSDGPAGAAVSAILAILAGKLGGRFLGRDVGNAIALGGLIKTGDALASQYVYPMIPGLGAYLDPGMGAYLNDSGLSAYMGSGAQVQAIPSGDVGDDDEGFGDITPSRLDADSRF